MRKLPLVFLTFILLSCSQQKQAIQTHRSPDDIHRYTTIYEGNRIITYEPYSAKNAEVKERYCKPTPNQETSVSRPQFHTLSNTERLAPTINLKNYNRKFNLYNSNAKARSKVYTKSAEGSFTDVQQARSFRTFGPNLEWRNGERKVQDGLKMNPEANKGSKLGFGFIGLLALIMSITLIAVAIITWAEVIIFIGLGFGLAAIVFSIIGLIRNKSKLDKSISITLLIISLVLLIFLGMSILFY